VPAGAPEGDGAADAPAAPDEAGADDGVAAGAPIAELALTLAEPPVVVALPPTVALLVEADPAAGPADVCARADVENSGDEIGLRAKAPRTSKEPRWLDLRCNVIGWLRRIGGPASRNKTKHAAPRRTVYQDA